MSTQETPTGCYPPCVDYDGWPLAINGGRFEFEPALPIIEQDSPTANTVTEPTHLTQGDQLGRATPESMQERALAELATIFYDRDHALLLATRAGFPRSRLPDFRTPLDFWTRVLEEASSGILKDGAQSIVRAAAELYPSNHFFAKARVSAHSTATIARKTILEKRIFISYSHDDAPRARGLYHLLRALGLSTFSASNSIPAGEDHQINTKRALEQCDTILVIWTKNAAASEQVKTEYTYALSQQPSKSLIPLCLDTNIPLPKELTRRRAVFLPVIQELVEQKNRVFADGGNLDDVRVVMEEILERHEILLSSRQRRDVLLFISGSALTLGAVAFVPFLNRFFFFVTIKLRITVIAAATVAISLAHDADATTTDEAAHSLDTLNSGTHPLAPHLTIMSKIPWREVTDAHDELPEGSHDSPTTTAIVSIDVCRGARLAIADLRAIARRDLRQDIPKTSDAAVNKYARGVYDDCDLHTSMTNGKPHLDIRCELRTATPVEAAAHYHRVLKGLHECSSSENWERSRLLLPSFEGLTPAEKMATRTHYVQRGCNGVSVQIYTGKCALLPDTYCSGFRTVLQDDFWECLDI